MKQENLPEIAEALNALIKGAEIQHLGDFFHDNKMTNRGLEMIGDAIDLIDARSPVGRDVLLPLLDYPDVNVRVTAAGGLWQSHHDRAVAVLQDIEDTCHTEAGMTAALVLVSKGTMAACGSDPRFKVLFPLVWD